MSRAPSRFQSPRQPPRMRRRSWLLMNQSSRATSPSDSSWDPILDFPDRRQLEDFLTEQERNDLRNLVLSVNDFCKPTPYHNDGLQDHEDGDNDDGNGNYKSSRPARLPWVDGSVFGRLHAPTTVG